MIKSRLVNVFPKGHPGNAIRAYTLFDDQRNKSLARLAFFDWFQIQGSDSSFLLHTCASISEIMEGKPLALS